ncbi:MAG: 16S rRNA (guanine(527)-N(7))-methyltransferase RsmG, partial [Bdellovibrionales bacterium]|nr:16S rRNA (guanine(527)-N(7))-methyltransferase RsmG [Bdellovibrionales bacterium]
MALESVTELESTNWRIKEWFPHLSEDAISQLRMFHAELLAFNRKINLISSRTESNSDLIHFADCVLGSELILKNCQGSEIYDFGSGNGLPGIILAILSPNYRIHLVESDARKAEFMKYMGNKLKLRNLVVHNCRIEDLPEGSVDFVVSRGLASVQKSISLARRACRKNARYFHFTGDSWV